MNHYNHYIVVIANIQYESLDYCDYDLKLWFGMQYA